MEGIYLKCHGRFPHDFAALFVTACHNKRYDLWHCSMSRCIIPLP